jgi:hypothetical protein
MRRFGLGVERLHVDRGICMRRIAGRTVCSRFRMIRIGLR